MTIPNLTNTRSLFLSLTLAAMAAGFGGCWRNTTGPLPAPVIASTHAPDLMAAGLDPAKLPEFDALIAGFKADPKGSLAAATPVMSLFASSLGRTCEDCHSGADKAVPAETRNMVADMWNRWVRGFQFKDGALLFCDLMPPGQERVPRAEKR